MNTTSALRVAWVSLGCPKNLVDSELMLGRLAEAGCVIVGEMDDADVAVINTCGFLAASREESQQVIGEAAALKEGGALQRIVVVGCYAQWEGSVLLELYPSIDAVAGVNERERIVEAVTGSVRHAWLSDAPPYGSPVASEQGRFRLTPRHTAYLRIGEGCSQHCAFCTIPAIRGPLRSKPFEQLLAEADELIADGARELNLIAQDTTAYGEDQPGDENLAKLLRSLDERDVGWLRLMYTYPRRFDQELIETIAGVDRVIPYIDMPLQHMATPVLEAMKRRVTGSDSRHLLDKLYDQIDGLCLRTSFIVGYPGERDVDFNQLCEAVQEYQFEAMGVFCFSPEPGTEAAELTNVVPAEVAQERAEHLMSLQRDIVFGRNAQLAEMGQPLEVLVDGVDEEGKCIGRFYGQAPDIDGMCILTEPAEVGEFVDTTVRGFDEYDLLVEPSQD